MHSFDKQFIKKLIAKDHNTFDKFYLKTVDMFFCYIKTNYFISNEDNKDILSMFYVKLRNNIDKIDINQNFNSYVWTILKNTIKDYFKKMSEIPFSTIDNYDEDSEKFEDNLCDKTNLLNLLEQDFKFSQIESAMKKLDNTSKDILYMKYIEELSNNEISEQLGISQDNIRQKLSRAIKHLKILLNTK